MKVDGLGIVLALILLPIILIVTYYIQLEVDTIARENDYNTKLLDATYDAMSAFEINTANEELSSVADSMRSIILASNNIFFNTLATNLGLSNSSKQYLEPYVPAVLYTLYDGYYIYAPTDKPKVAREKDTSGDLTTSKEYMSYKGSTTASDGKSISDTNASTTYGDVLYELPNGNYTVDPDKAVKDTDYVLKSYVQYSADYKYPKASTTPNIDVTINYTLDNYLNIVGTVNGVYYTKTGYLIKNGLVSSASTDTISNLLTYNENDAKEIILGNKTNSDVTTTQAAGRATAKVNNLDISVSWDEIKNPLKNLGYYKDAGPADTGGSGTDYPNIRTISEAEDYLARAYDEKTMDDNIRTLEYGIQKYRAIAYYTSSQIFSNWVYTNLKDLTPSNIDDSAMKTYYSNHSYESTAIGNDTYNLYNDFSTDTSTTIFNKDEDPEDISKAFYTHKLEVIKNSIKYNINLVMSSYNKMAKGSNDIKTLKNYEASMPILLDEEWDKILNNISIVSFMQGWDCGLTIYNNYEIVSSTNNELMVTPDEIYYVQKSQFNDEGSDYHRIDCEYLPDSTEYISFKSKDVKYDKLYDKTTSNYKYDHKNLACYTCINSGNYSASNSLSDNKRRAYYIGLGNARQSTYKTNALPTSEGFKVIESTSTYTNNATINVGSHSNVSKVQITFANTKSNITAGSGISKEPVLRLTPNINGTDLSPISLNLDQKKEQTVTIDFSGTINNSIILKKAVPNYDVTYDVKSIKVVYK